MRNRVAYILLGFALMAAAKSCSAGEVGKVRRMTRVTVLRPVRAHGRAQAGYPFLQTTANVSRAAANLSGLLNPIGWFL